jgi:hypothetical protein
MTNNLGMPDFEATLQTGNLPLQKKELENSNQSEDLDFEIVEPDFIKDMAINGNNQNSFDENPPNINVPTPSNESEISKNQYYNLNKTKNYHIIDMFWLNYEGDETINDNPNLVEFVIISYNLDFGNLRITFHQIPDNAINNNVVFNQSLKLLVAGTIYPSSAFKAIHTKKPFTCIEQLIIRSGEKWEKERPITAIQNTSEDENNLSFTIAITNVIDDQQFIYEFKDWQAKALYSCLEHTYKQGLLMRGQVSSMS